MTTKEGITLLMYLEDMKVKNDLDAFMKELHEAIDNNINDDDDAIVQLKNTIEDTMLEHTIYKDKIFEIGKEICEENEYSDVNIMSLVNLTKNIFDDSNIYYLDLETGIPYSFTKEIMEHFKVLVLSAMEEYIKYSVELIGDDFQ